MKDIFNTSEKESIISCFCFLETIGSEVQKQIFKAILNKMVAQLMMEGGSLVFHDLLGQPPTGRYF